MGKRYNKACVDTHRTGYYGQSYPAVNVKARNTPWISKIEAKFGCSEAQATKAHEFAFNQACQLFWEDVHDLASEIFCNHNVKVYGAGRSGGWACVCGLPPIEDWDCCLLAKWAKFERICLDRVKAYTSEEFFFDAIESNQWYKELADEYNFTQDAYGKTHCIADLKEQMLAVLPEGVKIAI